MIFSILEPGALMSASSYAVHIRMKFSQRAEYYGHHDTVLLLTISQLDA